MFKSIQYQVPEEVKVLVAEYLSTHNIANRGEFDGNYEKQFLGKVGECIAYMRLLNKIPNLYQAEGFDGGVDLTYKGFSIDVKTVGRKYFVKEDWANNFYDIQKKYPTDILLFCSYNQSADVVEICGWIFKCELETKGIVREAGDVIERKNASTDLVCTKKMWEVKNKDLYPIEYLEKYDAKMLKRVMCDRMKNAKERAKAKGC